MPRLVDLIERRDIFLDDFGLYWIDDDGQDRRGGNEDEIAEQIKVYEQEMEK